MKIYTKTGDLGQTGLFGGPRVSKDHIRIEAYGTLDELNAVLGVVLSSKETSDELRAQLLDVQNELFQLGSELATPPGKTTSIALVGDEQISRLESQIDGFEEKLEPLKNFILPGGSETSARLHLARTICRRAERAMVSLHQIEPLRPEALRYVNRMSDYLFVCAREANRALAVSDILWRPRK